MSLWFSLLPENPPHLQGRGSATRAPSAWCQKLFPLMKTSHDHRFGLFSFTLEEKKNMQVRTLLGFPGGSVFKKKTACQAGDVGLIPGSGRSPGEGNGNPLQYSCLENPMDRGAWWATVHGVAKSRKQLSGFTFTFLTLLSVASPLNSRHRSNHDTLHC